VFTGCGRRRAWAADQKARIIAESYECGETVSAVARRHGLTPQQLFGWGWAAAGGGRAGESGSAFAPVIVDVARPCPGVPIALSQSGGSTGDDRDRDRRHDGWDTGRGGCRDIADGTERREGGDVISVPAGTRVLVATKPVDFRRGAYNLVALVREKLGHDPFSRRFLSSGRSGRTASKSWPGTDPGWCCFWKRLEHGAFRRPQISDGVMRLTGSQLAALVDGMDWLRLHARDVARPAATS
jgi:transposase